MQNYFSRILLVFIWLTNSWAAFAQVHEIDSVMDLSPYYLPTSYAKIQFIEYEPLVFKSIDTSMVMTPHFDPLLKPENIYQELGIGGQAHQSMIFNYKREMGFIYQTLPYPLYFFKQSELFFPKLQTTYSKVAFTFGFFPIQIKNNELFATFARKIKDVTIDFNLYAVFNSANTDNKTNNLCGNILIHYETSSSIYGFKASAIINSLNNNEKSGLQDIFSYNASSKIFSFDFALQNYFNLFSKNKRYFGTFAYDFQYAQNTLNYYDKYDTVYHHAYESTIATNDSIRYNNIRNAIQWSNFIPYKETSTKNNFVHIAGGVLQDYTNFKYKEAALYKYTHANYNSFYLFARTHIRLFKVMDITAKISYAIVGYLENDLLSNAGISWSISRDKIHALGLHAYYYRVAPEYIMQHVESNYFLWNKTLAKQNIVQLKAYWNYKNYNASASYYYLNKLAYLSENLQPVQNDAIGNLIQFSTFLPFRFKNFGTTANLNVQYCTNDVIRVPIFAGKLSIFYIFELLKKRFKIHIGTDVMYNTSYFADGYLPVLRLFHYQNSQLVGNFVYWDANITFQVERINFFFRVSNLLSPFMYYQNFSTPYYPTTEYLMSIGISWKFFD